MSNMISFNTEEIVQERLKPVLAPQTVKTFELVAEDHPFLFKRIPEFDFKNSRINANEFASTLVETCKKYKGFGLSANQCGYMHRVFVMGADDNYVAFFNPVILESSQEEVHMIEGCLSFPLLGLRITRPKSIVVEYQDYVGEKHTMTLDGISARCFQHELDHLNGKVYTQKAKPLALKSGMDKRNKMLKQIRKGASNDRAAQLMTKSN